MNYLKLHLLLLPTLLLCLLPASSLGANNSTNIPASSKPLSGTLAAQPLSPGRFAKPDSAQQQNTAVMPAPKSYLYYLQDREKLEKLQRDTFKYMWEYCEPNSGMAYEANFDWANPPVAVGGTGFGIAAIVVATDRGWITREEGTMRLLRITEFLLHRTPRHALHGAFPHWINGETGETISFSKTDTGADIVETSLLMQGLLIARAYFNGPEVEATLRRNITELWEDVDWNWFAAGEENGLYWLWNKENGFCGPKILGNNECLITYILALASPTHPISRKTYDYWSSGSGYQPKNIYGYEVEAALPHAGPLFLAHYSFIGLDPRRMADNFVKGGYFRRNLMHTLSNRGYCLQDAPAQNHYGVNYWGLTACQIKKGYAANDPGSDSGTIAPTAALSSMPYTPHYAMQVLEALLPPVEKELNPLKEQEKLPTLESLLESKPEYSEPALLSPLVLKTPNNKPIQKGAPRQRPRPYKPILPPAVHAAQLQSRLWGPCGPYDAFSLREKWVSDRYLAIDQLPVVCMVENYRSALLWNLLMAEEEIQKALSLAGIKEPKLEAGFSDLTPTLLKTDKGYIADAFDMRMHPDTGRYSLPYWNPNGGAVRLALLNGQGREIKSYHRNSISGRNYFNFTIGEEVFEKYKGQKLLLTLTLSAEGRGFALPVRLN